MKSLRKITDRTFKQDGVYFSIFLEAYPTSMDLCTFKNLLLNLIW